VLVLWKSEPPKPAKAPPKERPVEAVVVGAVVPPKFNVKPVVPTEKANELHVDAAFKHIHRQSKITERSEQHLCHNWIINSILVFISCRSSKAIQTFELYVILFYNIIILINPCLPATI